jgi:hypothetical protein
MVPVAPLNLPVPQVTVPGGAALVVVVRIFMDASVVAPG